MMTQPRVLKPRRVFRDPSFRYWCKRWRGYGGIVAACARYLATAAGRGAKRRASFTPHDLGDRFFGMNVAPSPDPAGDRLQIDALRDLGVQAVRIDYGEGVERPSADRFLETLLAEGFPVLLHVVQDPDEAARMDRREAQERLRVFLDEVLARYGGRIEALEVGATPNRHSWSGYTVSDYAAAAAVAREAVADCASRAADHHAPLLVGPNVSDFAPYFTIGQLAACRRRGVCFDAMSDNLFVDRAGEPERHDVHVAGRPGARLARMDLVRKQEALAAIASRFGAGRCWCTYAHYTLDFGRARPRYVSEEQYANYLVRAHLLTAAAGQFERTYWGTLVSYYKGLIDETVRVRPYPPEVHHRFATIAPPSAWRRRERLFRAYATMTGFLRRARFAGRWKAPPHARVLEFKRPEGALVVGWTRDGTTHVLDLSRRLGGSAPQALVSRDGQVREAPARVELTESPVYLRP